MPDFVPKPAPLTATPAVPKSGPADIPGERRVEPRLPTPTIPVEERREITDAITFPASGRTIDRFVHAVLGRMTFGVSPAAAILAYLDWLANLALAPGRQAELAQKAWRKAARFAVWSARAAVQPGTPPCIEPLHQDRRFRSPDWQQPPFNFFYQWFLLNQQWWWNATTHIRGMSTQNEQSVSFIARQFLDVMSPSNFVATNPEVLKATAMSGGLNFMRGFFNLIQDVERTVAGRKPVGTEAFAVGRDVAVTPGQVVFRNRLIELIQYTPTTQAVHPEPILIVPAPIMKYYILDLSPENSMVRYLVGQGHTVFMISWKNPGPEDRDSSMDDYRRLGVRAALRVVEAIVPAVEPHAVGYCFGGILLTTAAAAMARDGEDRIRTLTLFTTELDFSEPGELLPFIDESQVAYIEDIMWDQGYLDGPQFAGAFQLLRSNDLIWSKMMREYLLGERQGMSDLMAWNADVTRAPYAMHSEVLRSLFLDNDLAEGRYKVEGRPVVIGDIRVPIFAVATTEDHVAPWKSVYKLHLLADTEVTFLLTNGGHNAGVVSEPGHPRRRYQVTTQREGERYVDADTWAAQVPTTEGSWWPEWQRWLTAHSAPERVRPPQIGAPEQGFSALGPAPGAYVFQD
ncbi:MAG: polyhydroxyalkanoic acid synthase [Burkholderiales bacterium]|nr:polyhydroxyalkanoic acid synthase [Burkholderiales bacterium]